MNKYWRNFLIASLIATIATLTIALSKNIFAQTNIKIIMNILSDSFFITGFTFVGVGALVFCAAKGAFDGIAYLFHSLFVTHNWSKTKFEDRQTYGEYVEEKHSKKKAFPSYIFLVGFAFVIISLIFLLLFYNV